MVRKIQFEGDDAAYIKFLEARVTQLEDRLWRSSQPPHETEASLMIPAITNENFDHNEAFEVPRGNTSQVHTPSEHQSHGENRQPASVKFARHRLHHKGQEGAGFAALEFIEYDPKAHVGLDLDGKCARDKSEKLQHGTLSRFTTFLDGLPGSKLWETWLSAFGHNERRIFLQKLIQPHGLSASRFVSLETPTESADTSSNSANISILSQYAQIVVSFGALNRQLGCFLDVVFISLCAVVLDIEPDKDNVYRVMRKTIGSDASSKQLLKLVRGAKWANNLMSLLSKTKWASMSWDVLCVAEHPVSFYARFNDLSLNPEHILNEMKTQIYEGTVLSDCSDSLAPFAIPLIVKSILGNSASLHMICEILGYELVSVERYQTLFHDSLNEGRTKKRQGSGPTEPSKRHCRDNCSSLPNDPYPRVTNILIGSSHLQEAQYNNNSHTTNQCQSQYRSSQDNNTSATDSSQSEDVPAQSSPGYIPNCTALSEDITIQASSVVHQPQSRFHPHRTAIDMSVSCPGLNASEASKISQGSMTSSSVLEEANSSEERQLASTGSTLTLPTDAFDEPLLGEFPFNPRDALYAASVDLPPHTFNQPFPSDFPFNPRDALYPASVDLPPETFNQPFPSEFPFNPRDVLYPASTDSILTLPQETYNQRFASEYPFNPREALFPVSIASPPQETPEQPLPIECPFNPPETLRAPSTALVPTDVAQEEVTSMPHQGTNWLSDVVFDASRVLGNQLPSFPSELQPDYRQSPLHSRPPLSC